jgi:phytoene desaturase
MKIAVIGSGIAGLAAASRLASAGHGVTIYEKNSYTGGKISRVEKDGFVWDVGPSFFTDPAEFERLFVDCGKDMRDYFEYTELDEACRYFFGDKILHGYDTPSMLADEMKRVFDEPIDNVLRFLHDIKIIYKSTGSIYLDVPFSPLRVFTSAVWKSFINIPKGAVFKSMHANHKSYFFQPETIKFFDRFATYIGSDPNRAPGLLSCIAHLEHNEGAYYASGGMYSITKAATKLAIDLGVDIKTSTEIKNLIIEGKKVVGVELETGKESYDVVINASDVANPLKWHDEEGLAKHAKKQQSSSALVVYLGIKGIEKDLFLHNVFFSEDYDAESSQLWQENAPYSDPTIYINITSVMDPSHAPKGCQNWFVMVNVPAGCSEEYVANMRKNVLLKLSKLFGKDFVSRIVIEQTMLTPDSIENKFAAYKGSIYGQAGNSWRGAFFRPSNKDKKLDNLYNCGVTTHPGGGIPLALRSAKIVAGMIKGSIYGR